MPIKKLDLRGQRAVKQLPALSSSIEEVDLRGTSVRDLAPLAALPRLRALNLRRAPVATLEPILGVTALEHLWAEKTRVASVEGISRLRKLRLLWLHDTKVTDLAPLAGLRKLDELDIAGLRPESWAFLEKLRSLRILDLYGTSFSDLALLEELPKLQLVRLAKTQVKRGAAGVRELDAALRERGGGLSFDDTPHWRALVLKRLEEAESAAARAEAAKSAPKPKRISAQRQFLQWSSLFVEVFTRGSAVLVRKGRVFQVDRAKITVKRFKTEEQARAFAAKVCAEAQRKKFAKASPRGVALPDLTPLA